MLESGLILVFDPDLDQAQLAQVRETAAGLGWRSEESRGGEQLLLVLSGDGDPDRLEAELAGGPPFDLIPILPGRRYWRLRGRRRFMSGLVGGLTLLLAVGVVVPIVGFLKPPKEALFTPRLIRAASLAELPENAARMVRFDGRAALLIHHGAGRFFAASALCTHMEECQLVWDPDRRQIVCPCHGDAYDLYGNVVQGPASIPLRTYPVEVLGGDLYLRRDG